MIRLPWLEGGREPPALRVALLPLDALALLYGAGARLHRLAYERGALPRRRAGCRVVSVGGLAAGGSGKTPLAAWLARALRRRDHRVVLASRGYARRRAGRGVTVVSDGERLRSSLDRAGDEPLLLAAHAPGVPVLVGARRARVALRAVSAFGAEVLVLDDGFQHHALARDVDIVTIDGTSGLGNRRVLPRGPLREPSAALRAADAVGVVDGPLAEADAALVRRHAAAALRFEARRRPVALSPIAGGAAAEPRELAGAEVGLLAGIARPAALRRSLEELGARVVAERRFADHHRYRPGDLRDLERGAALWVTTEKDAVKIPPGWVGAVDLRVLRIALEVDAPERLLDWLESRLARRPRRSGERPVSRPASLRSSRGSAPVRDRV